uniref:Innexin n=1 Tax=Macrostomum lignano TaxID=282301 RepID=A0A1I8FSA3_9PLAT
RRAGVNESCFTILNNVAGFRIGCLGWPLKTSPTKSTTSGASSLLLHGHLHHNYYQWVPFVLALECLLVYIPHVIWNFLSKRSGFDPNGLVRLAKQSVDLDERRRATGWCCICDGD